MLNKKIIIATGNSNKVREFKEMLVPLGFEVLSLKDLDITLDVEETGKTFEENSLIKAHYVSSLIKDVPVIADDSGLEIHALDNFPGIYSARFMEGRPYSEKCLEIIKRLTNETDRSANFTSAISLVNYKNEEKVFIGKTYGVIDKQIEGENGFGYDPIFISDDLHKSFGLYTSEEKNSVSHRGRALKQLLEYLSSNL